MFDSLSNSLQKIFKNLRGYGRVTERNVQDTLREVRLALLEADVHYQVAKDFIARVRDKALGEEVLTSITPGQQVIKRIHEELSELLGRAHKDFDLSARPTAILLLGLQGAGKTTTAAKLALRWKKAGRKVLLAACDLKRPAAVEQLRLLARQVDVAFTGPEPGDTVLSAGRRAMDRAWREVFDIVIYDTAGRLQIDEDLVAELAELRNAVKPRNTVLVLDSAIGQESVHVAQRFHEAVGLTGLILTKLDGDARGGAALSVHAVTGCPILLTGAGEKMEDLEPFYPDRMASRILGMGDIVSLVEKAQLEIEPEAAEEMERKMRKSSLDLEDFLQQMRQLKKMGPLENLLEMIPGANRMPAAMRQQALAGSGGEMKRTEAIIQSMTPRERRHPEILNAGRRRRIARGSGTQVSDVNELLRRFQSARKMMKRMKNTQKRLPRFSK